MSLCKREIGLPKVRYKTHAAAEKVRRHSKLTLYSYRCVICRAWHLSSEKSNYMLERVPSIAKLKRKLQNAAQLIAAQQRMLDAAQAKIAAAQQEHDAEISAIAALYARQHKASRTAE